MKNYSWRDVGSVSDALGIVSDLNELMRVVNELTRFDSNADRTVWVQRNYKNVLRATKSMFGRLTKIFYQQVPLYFTCISICLIKANDMQLFSS